jgi:hypothetical protein
VEDGLLLVLPYSVTAAKQVIFFHSLRASRNNSLSSYNNLTPFLSLYLNNSSGWNNEGFLNKDASASLSSHWHMSSDFMNSIAQNGEYRVNCFQSTNDYERLWKGVTNYKWSQTTSASSSTSLNGVSQYPTSWASHHWGLTSGNNEKDAVITSHSGNEWACAGNAGPNGEGLLQALRWRSFFLLLFCQFY